MTFLEALATDKPIRRKGAFEEDWWFKWDDEESAFEAINYVEPEGMMTWHPTREDFLASDWEVAG